MFFLHNFEYIPTYLPTEWWKHHKAMGYSTSGWGFVHRVNVVFRTEHSLSHLDHLSSIVSQKSNGVIILDSHGHWGHQVLPGEDGIGLQGKLLSTGQRRREKIGSALVLVHNVFLQDNKELRERDTKINMISKCTIYTLLALSC